MTTLISIISTIVGVLLTLILTPLFSDKIEDLLIRIGSKIRKKQRLSGEWSQRWWRDGHKEEDIPKSESHNVILRQLGNRIIGNFHSYERNYRLYGKISRVTYITGTWEDEIEGTTYNGSHQLIIGINADTMYGKWVGFSKRKQEVNSGVWEWKRPGIEKWPSETKV